MITLIIYLHESQDAKQLIEKLLEAKLIANASIDFNNIFYTLNEDTITQTVNAVITAQTKSMLFVEVEKFMLINYGKDVPIFSMPIMQVNKSFDQLIRSKTNEV